ncbi:MFS transporter [Acidipropionibacterium timonense]|uniref:MFS transporter n=1 Tax=Acidipropionibacterium timonense TaxID=2161818 RepID=UPI00102F6BD4|nr:MFS transporter [Acidipropionibacterium timonense]
MYALLLAIIYLAFISLGLPDSLVGAGWPAMHVDLGVPVSFAGIITVIIASGTIVSSLASERLTRRFGAGGVTAVSVAMTAAALFGFSLSTQFWMLCLWAVPYGMGAGAVDAALNNYVALHYAARHMNWLHSFWGVGASISPFIMSHAIGSGHGWPSAYRTIGTLQAVLTVILVVSLPLWTKVHPVRHAEATAPDPASDPATGGAPTPPDQGATPSTHVPLATAVRIAGVPAVLATFFAYCAAESTSILWAATYLVSDRGVDAATAAAFASLFVLGITAGRFLAGFVADRIGDRMLIRGGFTTVGVGVVLIAIPVGPTWLPLAGLVIAGLGSAPIYPAIIHSTPSNFGAENSQAIIGIQMAAAYTGSTLAPPLFGAISAATGLWLLPVYLGLLVILGLVMFERLNCTTSASSAARSA